MSTELSERMLNLKPGDRLCLFYKHDPAEQMAALVPFIQDALIMRFGRQGAAGVQPEHRTVHGVQ